MPQTSYTQNHAIAYEGNRGDSRTAQIYPARNNSGVELPYGRAVVFDTGAGTTELAAKLIAASGDKILGVSLFSQAHDPNTVNGGVAVNDMFNVITQGAVWVQVDSAVTPNSPVFARYAAGAGGSVLGRFRADADTATAVAMPNARFLSSGASGSLVLLQLNLP